MHDFIEFIKKQNFDLRTALYTLMLVPFYLVLRIISRFIKKWLVFLAEGVMDLLSKHVMQSLTASFSLKNYCKKQLHNSQFSTLPIPGKSEFNLSIDTIFVNLTLYNNNDQENYSNNNFLKIGNRIKVMGDPGSGKSSLVKKVFRDTCHKGLIKSKNSQFPIIIELKTIAPPTVTANYGEWFFARIKEQVSKFDVYKIGECFDNYATNNGLLIFLDGLDEVSSINYKNVKTCINQLSELLSGLSENNFIVLTMREQFYQQVRIDYEASFPHAAFLKPFTPSDIYNFLSRWHFDKEATKHISRIYEDLTDKPTLREMCSNPLILSMYVAEDQRQRNTESIISPETRTEFYKRVIDELIIRRRQKQIRSTSVSYTSIKQQREQILGRIAYNHLTEINEPRNNISWNNAIMIIQDVMKCDENIANDIFNDISTDTGLITVEQEKETFRFIHLTFCEFLAAFEVAQGVENGWDKLLGYHINFIQANQEGKSRLIEVIPFAMGLLPRVNTEKALSDVELLNDTDLMTRCFLETKQYRHKSWLSFVQSTKDSLLVNTVGNFDPQWLKSLHLFNIVLQDYNLTINKSTPDQVIDLYSFYESLIKNHKESIGKILSAFAAQDAAAVFHLCKICKINLQQDYPQIIIDNCDQIPFLGLLKDIILQHNHDSDITTSLICEAALEKRIVASTLNDMPKSEELANYIHINKFKNTWYCKEYIPETFYTQCLTIALNGKIHTNNTLRMKAISSPSENKIKFMITKVTSSILLRLIYIFTILTTTIIYIYNIYTLNYEHILYVQNKPTIDQKHIDWVYCTFLYFLLFILSTYTYFTFIKHKDHNDSILNYYLMLMNVSDTFYDSIYNSEKNFQSIKIPTLGVGLKWFARHGSIFIRQKHLKILRSIILHRQTK